MDYPIWGGASLIHIVVLRALIVAFAATVMAMSGMAMIMACEMDWARRSGDDYTVRFLKHRATAILIIPFIAVLALAPFVWQLASLIMPATVSAFVHVFMWIGALLGLAMIVESAVVFGVWWGWDRLAPRPHQWLMWTTAGTALMWLVTLAAGASFAITPGTWLQSFAFGDALINPTFVPLAIVSIAFAIALGASVFIVVINTSVALTPHEKHDLGLRLTRWLWALPASIPIAILFMMALPPRELAHAGRSFVLGGVATITAALYLALSHRSATARISLTGAALAAFMFIAALWSFACGMRYVNGPFAIRGYIYRNDIAVADAPRLAREGVLSRTDALPVLSLDLSRIAPERRGAFVYRALRYDLVFGRNGERLASRLIGLDTAGTSMMLRHMDLIDGCAPPFMGTERELTDLAAFIAAQQGEEH